MLLENQFLNLKCPIAFVHSVFFKPMFGHHFTETKDTLTYEYKQYSLKLNFLSYWLQIRCMNIFMLNFWLNYKTK